MARLFKRRDDVSAKASSPFYSYKSINSLRQSESLLYKRLGILFFLLVVVFCILYLWGIPLVSAYGTFWSRLNPNITPSSSANQPFFVAPTLDPLPSQINDLAKLKVSGLATAGLKVEVIVNDSPQKEVVADSMGRFEVNDLILVEGVNTIYAQVKKGDSTEKSAAQQVIFKRQPPKLEIEAPGDGLEITDPSQNWLTISGQTVNGVTVLVNDHQAIVDQEGKFRYQYLLSFGENKLTIKAEDEAGNSTVVEKLVKFNPPVSSAPTPSPS